MNKKLHLTLVSYLIITFLFLLLGGFLLTRKNSSFEQVVINYNEAGNPIDYKVYLKKNNFFETDYLGKGVTYISSLIDHIDVDFNYKISFDESLTGKYKYKVKASILANKVNDDGKYWSKDYDLDEKENTFSASTYISANQHVKLDYQQYNDLLSSFKKEYGLAIDGILHVEMIIDLDAYIDDDSVVICNNNCNHLVKSNVLKMDIPLTQSSVDISINTNESSTSNGRIVYDKKVSESFSYIIIRCLGIISLLFALITIINMIKYIIRKRKMISDYHKEINKILSTYDSIIVNSDNINNLSKYNVIKVNSFEELLDAHSEVRMPINYVELKDNYSIFVLINNDVAWVYQVIGDEYEEE